MKKHELLKYAYDNYQKGINFKNIATGQIVESTGKFILSGFGVYDEGNNHYLYSVTNDDKWAEIVTEKQKSILDGKVAIEVKNEREFKLLMQHYESKGWKAENMQSPISIYSHQKNGMTTKIWKYGAGFHGISFNNEKKDCKIISFEEFAKEIGIELPVFIMKSEDGVDLYKGDNYIEVVKYGERWSFSNAGNVAYLRMGAMCNTEEIKAFSTKETAEAWILEANKLTKIAIYNKTTMIGNVNIDGFWPINSISYKYGIPTEIIHDIYNASQKINS